MKTDLYFEVHITLDPIMPESEMGILLRSLTVHHGFRVAKFVMNEQDSFLTTRGTDYDDVVRRTKNMVESLRLFGFPIRRYKLENTILDTKATNTDPLGCLTSIMPVGGN